MGKKIREAAHYAHEYLGSTVILLPTRGDALLLHEHRYFDLVLQHLYADSPTLVAIVDLCWICAARCNGRCRFCCCSVAHPKACGAIHPCNWCNMHDSIVHPLCKYAC